MSDARLNFVGILFMKTGKYHVHVPAHVDTDWLFWYNLMWKPEFWTIVIGQFLYIFPLFINLQHKIS